MAALSARYPTLIDLAKATDPNGQIAQVAEILAQENGVIEDVVQIEANDTTVHRTTVRTGYSTPTWRRLYGGVQPDKGTVAQITDGMGMLHAYAEADADLVDMSPNPGAFRLIEDRAHIEGIRNTYATTLFYGNETTSDSQFTGLAARYNSLSGNVGTTNVINHGGSGSDNASIWLCVWGPNTGHGIYPRGMSGSGGLKITDKGRVTLESAADGNGGRMEAYRTHYQWNTGLSIRDWRYFVRIANIDVSDALTVSNAKNIVTSMIRATERIPNFGIGRPVFYLNRNIREALRLGILEKITSNLTWETVEGQRVMMFDGIPVKRCDALLNTEAAIS